MSTTSIEIFSLSEKPIRISSVLHGLTEGSLPDGHIITAKEGRYVAINSLVYGNDGLYPIYFLTVPPAGDVEIASKRTVDLLIPDEKREISRGAAMKFKEILKESSIPSEAKKVIEEAVDKSLKRMDGTAEIKITSAEKMELEDMLAVALSSPFVLTAFIAVVNSNMDVALVLVRNLTRSSVAGEGFAVPLGYVVVNSSDISFAVERVLVNKDVWPRY
jgi:hypothetical protein